MAAYSSLLTDFAPWSSLIHATVCAYYCGDGSALPERRLTNADLEKLVETTERLDRAADGDAGAADRGGGESTATLATAAARKALDDAGISPRIWT